MCIVDLKEGMWDRKEQVSMGNWNEQRAQSATSELLSDRLYVSHYKKCEYLYRSWNYWHLTMLHAKAMSVVVEYDMYLEVAEGNLRGGWNLDEPMDLWRFREIWRTECWSTIRVQGINRGQIRWDPRHNRVIYSGQTEREGDLDNHTKLSRYWGSEGRLSYSWQLGEGGAREWVSNMRRLVAPEEASRECWERTKAWKDVCGVWWDGVLRL